MNYKTFISRSFTLSLVLVAAALIFNACTKEDLNFAILDAEQIVTESQDNQAKYFVGSVSVKAESEIGAVLHIDDDKATIVSHHILVSTKQFNNLDVSLAEAEVLFFSDHIIVNALDRNFKLLLKLDDSPQTDLMKSISFNTIIDGYEIGEHLGSPFVENTNGIVTRDLLPLTVVVARRRCVCIANATNPAPTCHSGGPGSTGCSSGGGSANACEVSCNGATHYACCS